MLKPHLTILALCLFLCTCVSAQNILTGRILDSLTSEPIPFATVYLDGTSIGETTGDDGTFSLKGMRLPATLVVSHLAYQTEYIELVKASSLGDIILSPREAIIYGVEIRDQNLRGKTLAEFTRLLLGQDEWAVGSSIRNDEVLGFDRDYTEKTIQVRNDNMRQRLEKMNRSVSRWNKDKSEYTYGKPTNLKAKSRGILKVHLPHLGYSLRMDLNTFLSDYKTGYTSYLGTYFFEEDTKPTVGQRRNRERAYYGSGMHFARALLSGTLEENGFQVFTVSKDEQGKRENVAEVDLGASLVKSGNGTNTLVGLEGREFAILYYADGRSHPLPKNKWRRNKPIQSRVLAQSNKCVIYKGGIFGDTNLVFNGNIGSRSLAWALPVDFVLETE
jgi:hypothetical protein